MAFAERIQTGLSENGESAPVLPEEQLLTFTLRCATEVLLECISTSTMAKSRPKDRKSKKPSNHARMSRCEKCFEDDVPVCPDDQAKTKTTLRAQLC